MPAIGSVWASGTWNTDAWAADTWENAVAPVAVIKATSPTRLLILGFQNYALDILTATGTRLDVSNAGTVLTWFADDGDEMSQPLTFTATEIGALALALTGADGTRQNLTGAASVTLTVASVNGGTPVVNAVALTVSDAAQGEVTWTRLAAQVATAGDYRMQVRAVLSNGDIVFFPDANPELGYPMTLLKVV